MRSSDFKGLYGIIPTPAKVGAEQIEAKAEGTRTVTHAPGNSSGTGPT